MDLFADPMIAIGGSKFKAVNNCDKNFTQAKIESSVQQIEKSIQQYLDDLEAADIRSPKKSTPNQVRLTQRITMLLKSNEIFFFFALRTQTV